MIKERYNLSTKPAPGRPVACTRHTPWVLRWRISLLALVLSFQAGWSSGQESNEVFIESVRVHVVNVDVVVTDRNGQPVQGLVQEDFELQENGQVVAISNFRAPGAHVGVQPIDSGTPPSRDPGTSPAEPPRAELEQEQSLVLFIDNLHLQPASRNRALRRLRGSLSEIVRPGDRVMVVSFERSLHVRQTLTRDLEQVRRVLIEAEELSTFGGQALTERERLLARIESARSLQDAEASVDAYAKSEYFNVDISFGGVRQLIDLLAGLPGRKVVLHISDGLPITAAAGLFHLLDLRFQGGGTGGFLSQRYNLRDEMRELAAAANAQGVTIYTLEAMGAGAPASASAARAGVKDVGTYLDAELARLASSQETLMELADFTGGVATVGTNNVTLAYDRIAFDRQAIYSLGFHSNHQGDGRYYPLEVKVKKKGLRVRHRKGYRDKALETQLEESAFAALRYGTGENALGLRLEVGAPRRQNSGSYLVPFELQIPFSQITLVPREQFFVGQVRLVQVALDKAGERSNPEQNVLPLRIPATEMESALTQNVIYEAELLMEAGEHRLVVGVLDELSTTTAMVRKVVQVGNR